MADYSYNGSFYDTSFTTCDMYPLPLNEKQAPDQFEAWLKRKNECCERIQTEAPPSESHCELVWDTWDCWNWTAPGDTLIQTCPWWVPDASPMEQATKTCMPDGTWYVHPGNNNTWTNYTACEVPYKESPIRFIIFEAGYSTSVIALCLALFIFTYFQSLGCPRVTIHKNLFISFILSAISNIIWHVTIIVSSRNESGTACRFTYIMAQFFVLCNYFWMLSEGLYLHTVIVVAVFSENHDLLLYYIVGWVIPMVPAVVLLILQLTLGSGKCWTESQGIEWVIGGTIIAVLLTNAGLLLNIVRVLVTKLRATPSQGARTYVRAVRATIILLPLMGLHYIIIPVRPSDNQVAELVYDCIIAFLISFQGFFVACIFCFFNGEVISQLHRSIRNFTLVHYSHTGQLQNGTDGPSQTQVKMQIRRKWLSNWQLRRSSEFRTRHTTVTVTEAVSTTPPLSVNLHQEKENIDNYTSHPPKGRNEMNGENGKTAKKSVGFADDHIGSDTDSTKPLMLGSFDSEKTTVV